MVSLSDSVQVARASIRAAASFSCLAPPKSSGHTSTRHAPAAARTTQRVTTSSTTPTATAARVRLESLLTEAPPS